MVLNPPGDCPAEEYKFEVGEIDVKPYHFGGYAEIDLVLFGLNRDSRLYKQRFYNRDEGSTLDQQGFTLQLDGAYEKGIARVFARINSELQHTYEGWSGETALYEGFLSLKPSPFVTVDTGKKTMKWGKGYAWNPVAFLDRPKDPDDPTLNLEGFYVASMDYIRSFNGPLKTFSFTPALVPVYGDMNKDFGEEGHLNPAAKIYFLFLDTDIDFMFLAGGSRPHRYGFDFSRNLATNLEVHGELAWIKGYEKRLVDGRGTFVGEQSDSWSYLVGLRYLTARETTYVLEYYYNGAGFSEEEMEDYFTLVDRGYDAFLATGRDTLLRRSQQLTQSGYGRANPMKSYLYLRISQKDPFDILYFTPALTWIANVDDRSFSVSPELLYTGFTNIELRLKGTVLVGDEFSEFGEKQNDYRVELRARYYF
ncbi:MAG: hypothetical protein C4576_31160 [Desulfobacteraceae bacterium]|nr:MAG: hypothetical protein C4576_31160 [Desulfobacteraceae bacterium]